MNRIKLTIALSLIVSVCAQAQKNNASQSAIKNQVETCEKKLLRNLNDEGVRPGVVIASPSKEEPNYYYHWTRDAGIVMQSIDLLNESDFFRNRDITEGFPTRLKNYVFAEIEMEKNGYGEPKHHVDTSKFDEPWGRPQNDGPAFRILNYIKFLEQQSQGEAELIQKIEGSLLNNLYYLKEAIHKADFEPWEEVTGYHFFNRLVQLKAFQEAHRYFQNKSASNELLEELRGNIESLIGMLNDHLHTNREIISASLGITGEDKNKKSNLDISVLLAALYTDFPEAKVNEKEFKLAPDNEQLQNTVSNLISRFQEIYSINQQGIKGVLIGRYPEDIYDGHLFSGGNPWALTTLALGEYYARLYSYLSSKQSITITLLNRTFYTQLVLRTHPSIRLRNGAFDHNSDEFKVILQALKTSSSDQLERTLYHTDELGDLPEQFNKVTGFGQGAKELSWSHISFLRSFYFVNKIAE